MNIIPGFSTLATGEVKPYGMQDSTKLFQKAGNIFITYLEAVTY